VQCIVLRAGVALKNARVLRVRVRVCVLLHLRLRLDLSGSASASGSAAAAASAAGTRRQRVGRGSLNKGVCTSVSEKGQVRLGPRTSSARDSPT